MKIKDCCKVIVPMRDKPKNFSGNIPWCRIDDIDGKFLNGSKNNLYVDQNTVEKMHLHVLPAGTVICAVTGASIGTYAITTTPLITNQTFAGIVCGDSTYNEYLYYFLKLYTKVLINLSVGCAQAYLTRESIENIDIGNLSFDQQVQKAKILKNIDEKIVYNNAISSQLESLAKTIYDYWFLQFDFPDENGNPYRSSGGKMVWNDELKREIPEGWGVQPLSHFIAYSKNGDWGNKKPKKTSDICVNCFRGADFTSITNDYHMTAPVRYISVKNKDRLLADGDLVTEISGGSPTQATGRIGYINKGFLDRSENDMTCSNFCKAITLYDKSYQYWLYQTWKFLYDVGAMFNYESKTTGIKNLMFDEFVTWNKVPKPNCELALLYQKQCDLYYGKIQSLLIENQELASLRDFLLPLLMNGQVTFKED